MQGRNVIDTAINYRDGRAEKAVGRALQTLIKMPGFSRDMLFVSTKAGFTDVQLLQRLLISEKVEAAEVQGGIHCIAPACLQASLDQSLASLGLQTVLFLLSLKPLLDLLYGSLVYIVEVKGVIIKQWELLLDLFTISLVCNVE